MSKTVSESIWSSDSLVIPMADVQHIEKRKLTKPNDQVFLMVIMKSTRYNFDIDDWDNPVYIPHRQTQSFLSAWCMYRYELEIDTLADLGKAALPQKESE